MSVLERMALAIVLPLLVEPLLELADMPVPAAPVVLPIPTEAAVPPDVP